MTEESAPVLPGELVAGKYRVGHVLGQGGRGVVVAAHHLELDQPVALKFLLPSAMVHLDAVARFTREARSAAKIQSEHVARVLDVGALSTGEPYLVMEYLEGEDLERVLAVRGPLRPAEAVDLLLQACEAVAEAHSLGIVHRDLKPANLFLATRPSGKATVKVLDFGISKAPASADSALTGDLDTFGSPLYMSPEQVTSSKSVDARSDIWSLGVVLYELLTGRHLFDHHSIPELCVAILHDTPRPPSAYRADILPLLEAAIMRCLEKDPTRRFPHVAALAWALAPFGGPQSAVSVERITHVLGAQQPAAPAATATGGPAVPPSGALLRTGEGLRQSVLTRVAPPRSGPARIVLGVVILITVGGAAIVTLIAIGNAGLKWVTRERNARAATATTSAASAPAVSSPTDSVAKRAVATDSAAAKSATATPAPERAAQPKPVKESGTARTDPAKASAVCGRLLERMSLGEVLTEQEKSRYLKQCRK